MNVSIIVPILNEEIIIGETIQSLLHEITPHAHNLELIAVNDGSNDGTLRTLRRLAANDERIRIVNHEHNQGYGAAIRSGVKASRFEWIFLTDADLQFNPSDITQLIPFTDRFDFIVGYRLNRADSLRRKIISGVYNRIVRLLFSLPLRDVDCAFKLMRQSAIKHVPFRSNSFFVSAELIARALKAKYHIHEVGVVHYPRRRGESKVTYRQIFLTLKDLIRLRLTV